jgi:hypothetical protein
MSYKLQVATVGQDNAGRTVRGRKSVGGAKSLEEARTAAAAQLESQPVEVKSVVIVNDAGEDVETVDRE